MSDSDSFIEEVSEEVRRDALYKYVRRFGWIPVVLIIGAVGTTGYLEWKKAQSSSMAQALGDSVIAALEGETPAERAKSLDALVAGSGSASKILQLRRAGELLEAGDKAGAVQALKTLGETTDDPLYKDLAELKLVVLQGNEMDALARDAILDRLAAPGQVFRPLALEQKAVLALGSGQNEAAIEMLSEILLDSESTDSLRGRARQIIIALGGEPPAISQLLSSQ